MMSGFYRLFFLVLLPLPVVAEPSSEVASLSGSAIRADLGAQLVQVLGGLGVVLAMVMVLAWLAKRVTHSRMSGTHGLRLLGGLSVGAKERIVLVQAGDTQMLIGVAPGRLQTLHVLDEPIQVQEKADTLAGDNGFGQKLAKLLNQEKGKGK
jgi:flagellar protein FliO/FliZ